MAHYTRICVVKKGRKKPVFIYTFKDSLWHLGVLNDQNTKEENEAIYQKHYHDKDYKESGRKVLKKDDWSITREPITNVWKQHKTEKEE